MSSRTLAALLTLGAVVVGGCTAPEPSPAPAEPVVVGVLVDSSQEEAAGADAVRGGELAVELVNGSYPELGLPLAALYVMARDDVMPPVDAGGAGR